MESAGVVFAVVEWGELTVKDLVYGGAAVTALLLGYRKVWCWYYQLEDQIRIYREMVELERTNHKATLEQLRADFKLQLDASEERADSWRELVMDGRTLVRQSVTVAAELAKRNAV